MNRLITLVLLSAAAFASGCATIANGTTDQVTIETTPPGARCELRQGAGAVYQVNPTPGAVEIAKSRRDVTVTCEKDGYLPEAGVLASELKSLDPGSMLAGGLIGVAIDASTGALTRYPPMLRLTLVPESFPDQKSADDWYAERRAETDAAHETALTLADAFCNSGNSLCEERKSAVNDAYNATLADLGAKHKAAKIAPGPDAKS